MEQYDDFIGKRLNMFLDSHPRPLRVEIIKINPETRRGTKFRAVYRRDAPSPGNQINPYRKYPTRKPSFRPPR